MAKKQYQKVKEPVRIRFKELANGNRSIYLDTYTDGKRQPKEVLRHDTIWLPYTTSKTTSSTTKDTTSNDADFALVPIMQYEYRDTFVTDTSRIELGIRYEGYRAKIDGIDIKSQYTIQPRTIVKKKGWGQFIGIGIGVGYGASVVGQTVYAAPEIGLHVTYGWGYHW